MLRRPIHPMPGKFEIKRAKDGEYYFNLLAGNHEVILTSEMYKAKASAKNGIESVRKNSISSSMDQLIEGCNSMI